MDRGRKEGARSSRHRRSIEDMREIATSTPAIEPRSLRYNETTAESSESTDTQDYSYDPRESETSFHGFSQSEQEQAEVNDKRDQSELEWDDLQVAQFSGEEEELIWNS